MLKMTKIELEKINNPNQYMFFEQGIRGGVSYTNTRYSEAFKNKHILYFDMNNLYGDAMNQYLPYANFKWVKNINKIEQTLMQIKKDSSTGYILKVDLEYPQELHGIHNDYPLAPEKNEYTKRMVI